MLFHQGASPCCACCGPQPSSRCARPLAPCVISCSCWALLSSAETVMCVQPGRTKWSMYACKGGAGPIQQVRHSLCVWLDKQFLATRSTMRVRWRVLPTDEDIERAPPAKCPPRRHIAHTARSQNHPKSLYSRARAASPTKRSTHKRTHHPQSAAAPTRQFPPRRINHKTQQHPPGLPPPAD